MRRALLRSLLSEKKPCTPRSPSILSSAPLFSLGTMVRPFIDQPSRSCKHSILSPISLTQVHAAESQGEGKARSTEPRGRLIWCLHNELGLTLRGWSSSGPRVGSPQKGREDERRGEDEGEGKKEIEATVSQVWQFQAEAEESLQV